jgi:hypothetical protein
VRFYVYELMMLRNHFGEWPDGETSGIFTKHLCGGFGWCQQSQPIFRKGGYRPQLSACLCCGLAGIAQGKQLGPVA